MNNCRTCGAPILFVKTNADKLMPIDAEPCEDGNVRVATAKAEVLGPLEVEAARAAGERLYISHFATCPNAAEHRKAR